MAAAIGTIPYFSAYQPGALPIASTVFLEIVDSDNATTAASYKMAQTDLVGKAPSVMVYAPPLADDNVAFYQSSTGLPRMCRAGDFGLTVGNLPAGGATGTFLSKLSGTSYAAVWTSIVDGPLGVIGTALITGTLSLNGSTTTRVRQQLTTSSFTYFVRAAGNDANDGLTAASAFATVQKGIDSVMALDRASYQAWLNIGPGNWDGGGDAFHINAGVNEGQSGFNIRGAGSGLTSISLAANGNGGGFLLHEIALDAALGNGLYGIQVGEYSEVVIQEDVLFKTNTPGAYDCFIYDCGAISFTHDYSISGDKAAFMWGDNFGRFHHLDNVVITLVGTPTLSAAYFKLRDHMQVIWEGATTTGSISGLKYEITGSNVSIRGTVANIPGSGQTFVIDDAAGSVTAENDAGYYLGTVKFTHQGASRYRDIYDNAENSRISLGPAQNATSLDPTNYYYGDTHSFWDVFQNTNYATISTASLFTGAFGIVGTALMTGRFGVVGTATFTGLHGIIGTTLVTGIFGVVGTATFTGAYGIIGTTLITGRFGIVGTTLATGLFNVVGNLVLGTAAIASAATDGFLYLPTTNGTPTGTPTSFAGRAAVVVDDTNNRLYFYSSGAWRNAGP